VARSFNGLEEKWKKKTFRNPRHFHKKVTPEAHLPAVAAAERSPPKGAALEW